MQILKSILSDIKKMQNNNDLQSELRMQELEVELESYIEEKRLGKLYELRQQEYVNNETLCVFFK